MGIVHQKLGEALRIEREHRKQNIADLASQLKISDTILTAIEEGNLDALPSEVYYNLFAKSYSEYLGIDFLRTIEAIREELGEPDPAAPTVGAEGGVNQYGRPAVAAGKQTVPEPEVESGGSGKKLAGWIIVIVLVVAALALSYKFLVMDKKKAAVVGEPGIVSQAPPTQAPGTEVTTAGEYLSGPFTLTLVSRGQCWVTVLVDGESRINREVNAGESVDLTANTSMVVTISEPLLIDVKINGRPVDLMDPRTKSIMRVIVNHNTLASYLPPNSDTTGSDTVQSPDSGQKVDTTTR